eukprot:scaffold79278_cov18-Prasinocladus_malaysianus.AAC.1
MAARLDGAIHWAYLYIEYITVSATVGKSTSFYSMMICADQTQIDGLASEIGNGQQVGCVSLRCPFKQCLAEGNLEPRIHNISCPMFVGHDGAEYYA